MTFVQACYLLYLQYIHVLVGHGRLRKKIECNCLRRRAGMAQRLGNDGDGLIEDKSYCGAC